MALPQISALCWMFLPGFCLLVKPMCQSAWLDIWYMGDSHFFLWIVLSCSLMLQILDSKWFYYFCKTDHVPIMGPYRAPFMWLLFQLGSLHRSLYMTGFPTLLHFLHSFWHVTGFPRFWYLSGFSTRNHHACRTIPEGLMQLGWSWKSKAVTLSTAWESQRTALLGTSLIQWKVTFESMIFPFPRWDMWSFPGGYCWGTVDPKENSLDVQKTLQS